MSLSKEWTHWHLTPRGWESGTESTDFGYTERPRPADAVLTMSYREELGHAFGKMHRLCTEQWRSPDAPRVEGLLAKFGACPQSL